MTRREIAVAAGVPTRFCNRTFEDFETPADDHKETLDVCQRHVARHKATRCQYLGERPRMKEDPKSLLLHGIVGCGKTHLAACMLTAIVEAWQGQRYRPKAAFVRCVSLAAMLRTEIEEKKNGEALKPYEYPPERLRGNARETMNECDILILDDLGHEKPGFAREAVTEAIMTRYDECLPTIFTTNLNWPPLEGEGSKEANQVAVTYGEPVDSRLRESCSPWRCPERDFRIRKAKD